MEKIEKDAIAKLAELVRDAGMTLLLDGKPVTEEELRRDVRERALLRLAQHGAVREWQCRCWSDPAFDRSMNPAYVARCDRCGAKRPFALEGKPR